MTSSSLLDALTQANVEYETIDHAKTETALAEARLVGVAPDEVGKTLVLAVPSGRVRAVVPACERLDLGKLARLLGVARHELRFLSEGELARTYPDFEVGAVPPLAGPLDTVVLDARLAARTSVVIEAGTHETSLRLAPAAIIAAGARVADLCRD